MKRQWKPLERVLSFSLVGFEVHLSLDMFFFSSQGIGANGGNYLANIGGPFCPEIHPRLVLGDFEFPFPQKDVSKVWFC